MRLRPVPLRSTSWADYAIFIGRWLAFALAVLAAAASGRWGEAGVLMLLGSVAAHLVVTGALTLSGRRAGQWMGLVCPLIDLGLIAWAGQVFGLDTTGLYYVVILLTAVRYGAGYTLCAGIASSLIYLAVETFLARASLAMPNTLVQAAALLAVGGAGAYLVKLKEAECREKERISESETSKSDLLSVLSHEVRNRLAMIKGAVDLLLEGGPGPTTKQQHEFLTTISDQGELMIDLAEKLLAAAWMEAGKLELKRAPVDVRVLARDAVRDFRRVASKKGQDINLDYPQVLGEVKADAHWVQQVIINLLSNASKYTTNGGHIYVSVKENVSHLLVSVTDDGAGVPREEREDIFKPFSRGKDSGAAGTGLGLAIVKHVVTRHGGKVMMDSTLGKGTTLLFTLPKERPDGTRDRRRLRWNGLRR